MNFYDKNTYLALVNIKNKLKFAKSHIYRVLGASKVKSDFSTYFSIEKSYSKKVFCIINLVHWQVYRLEKVGIYLHSLAKKSIFSFLHIPILGVILKKSYSAKGLRPIWFKFFFNTLLGHIKNSQRTEF